MVHILGIRHHGPGSARSVRQQLTAIRPDLILVEGPPEADAILPWASHPDTKPPVAILCFQPDQPQHSSFYPFAEFSPEWQAILYANENKIPVRFMDLPAAHSFALEKTSERLPNSNLESDTAEIQKTDLIEENTSVENDFILHRDPLSHLAHAAGETDGEKWWEQLFEHRNNHEQVFVAVMEAMQCLRETLPKKEDRMEQLREAWMRKCIRQAEKEMYTEIAVVCGAWHAPALKDLPKAKEDNELLKGLPKVKIETTWVPWTYNRLSFFSGYGAGIQSPGWYEHVWNYPNDDGTRWMARVASLFRQKQMDTSVAHVMEAVRLSNALAALRGRSKAGLEELNEATLSVLCNGENMLLALVNKELIISDKIGSVPLEIPKPPLQMDIEKLQKKLRLPPTADVKDYTLDLRKENDLERSVFLHRLNLLGINWGDEMQTSGKGTFKELWRLQWEPEMSVVIIEKGTWGNTVEEAAGKLLLEETGKSGSLSYLCEILQKAIPADLPEAVEGLIQQINNRAATGNDVNELMQVVPGLVNITRYGNVRKTDAAMVLAILTEMITRICISLPAAATGIDEEVSLNLLDQLQAMNNAVGLLQLPELELEWKQCLKQMAFSEQTAPAVAGYATRVLADYKELKGEELLRHFFYSMSKATAPSIAANWLEGFLRGSGTLLLVDDELWNVVNSWVDQLEESVFTQLLPLLRRTFASFTSPERRKLGEKLKTGGAKQTSIEQPFDETKMELALPVVMKILGYSETLVK